MSDNTVVKVTTENWFSRIGKSFGGLIVGPILVIIAVIVLAWNEGRAARTAAALSDAHDQVISINADAVDPAKESKLVHLTGLAATDAILRDETFGVEQSALALNRTIKVYVWKENKSSTSKKELGGRETTTTTYTYEKVWADDLIDSSGFERKEGHVNPSSLPVSPETYLAEDVRLAAFQLDTELVKKIDQVKPLTLTNERSVRKVRGGSQQRTHLHDGGLYLGADPRSPQIGDVIVRFTYVPPTSVSLVAQQAGNTLKAYSAPNGTTIALVETGTHSADALFESAQSENTLITWLLRLVGLILTIIGFAVLMRPLSVIADVVPFIGSLVGAGTGLVSIALGSIVSITTIAIAWIAYRPMAAALLLAGCAAIAVFIYRRKAAVPAG